MATKLKKDKIYEQLKTDILSGKYPAATRLPNETEFAKQLGVGQITLRYALKLLKGDGLVERTPSRGTWVTSIENRFSKTKEICIISNVSDRIEFFPQYVFPGIYKGAYQNGFDVSSYHIEWLNSLTPGDFAKFLEKKNVRAIVLGANGFNGNEKYVRLVKDLNLPVIVANAVTGDAEATGFATIVINQKKTWKLALNHLKDNGRKEIAVIGLNEKSIRGYNLEEHINIVKEIGANHSLELVKFSTLERAPINKSISELLSMPKVPDAILCTSDFYAMHVCDILTEMGVKIGEDIAVMGICGYPGAETLPIPLTTVDFGYEEMGKMAVELAIKAAESTSGGKDIMGKAFEQECKLVVRKST